ncbi:MAG: twin-arginine translocase TatA/TatE family subunit [Bacteroidales bacterium]|jgi:sec-independent protein translocase protein TatB|nr:twin-arginine translocase TatA/TatE family subunit [Bacteroidales bacterium]
MGNPLLLFDISAGEMIIIILAIMVLFGPKQIPAIARTIGKALYEVRKASDQIKKEVMTETSAIKDILNPDQILKNNNSDTAELNKKTTPSEPVQEDEPKQTGEPNKTNQA